MNFAVCEALTYLTTETTTPDYVTRLDVCTSHCHVLSVLINDLIVHKIFWKMATTVMGILYVPGLTGLMDFSSSKRLQSENPSYLISMHLNLLAEDFRHHIMVYITSTSITRDGPSLIWLGRGCCASTRGLTEAGCITTQETKAIRASFKDFSVEGPTTKRDLSN